MSWRRLLLKLAQKLNEPPTQPSLFNYNKPVEETRRSGLRELLFLIKPDLGQPPTQPSLFHHIKQGRRTSRFTLREILSLLKPDLGQPPTQPSLFRYIRKEAATSKEIKLSPEVLEALAKRASGVEPGFIPSIFADFSELGQDIKQLRRRRIITASISLALHVLIIGSIILLMIKAQVTEDVKAPEQTVVMLTPALPMIFQGEGRSGGGGGGGGKRELTPPSPGRVPKTSNYQVVPPDPKPMEIPDAMIAEQSIVVPIDIPQNQSLPIGDITAPPGQTSSGPGGGGGIGTGYGTGIGSGRGPGLGPGSGGGMGGGHGGGVGSGEGPYIAGMGGVRNPEPIYAPPPNYTEEARRAKIEGVVAIQVIVRKDGSVDSPRVLRGLGYGLDEEAVKTIVTKWKFKPGTKDGRPVDVIAFIEVTFRLL